MGHYDSCYEAEEDRVRSIHEAARKRKVRLIDADIKKYGIAEVLVRIKEGHY
jgi:hypothetical protein